MSEELQCVIGIFLVVATLFILNGTFTLTVKVIHMTYNEYLVEQGKGNEEESDNDQESQ